MPQLLRWQAELLAVRMTDQPAVQTALTNLRRLGDSLERVSHAAESFSQTAAQLPDRLAHERKAVLDALDQQEGKLRELTVEMNRLVVHTDQMSGSLSVAITNFDALMKRFGVGEPGRKTAPGPHSRPFDIQHYGRTADQIGDMARNLNLLITSANQSVPQLERLSQSSSADLERVVQRAYWRGLALILVLLAGSVAAGLVYRMLINQMSRGGRSPAESKNL